MGSLAKELDAFTRALIDRTCLENACVLRKLTDAPQACETAYREGDVAPDFTLPDQFGHPVSLAQQLKKGPLVLLFVRGGWSPFCEITMRAYDRSRPLLRGAGGDVLAISPQAPAQNLATAEANWLSLPVLSDRGGEVARRYGLMRPVDDEHRELFLRLGHDIPRLNGIESWELPVTAIYVIRHDGVIARAHTDPRGMKRMEPADAIAAVREETMRAVA